MGRSWDKNPGEYNYLHFRSNAVLLANVLENFWNMYLEIYEPDRARFLTAPRLAWQVALNKTKLKLELLTRIDMLLMVEKGIKRRICHAIHRYL